MHSRSTVPLLVSLLGLLALAACTSDSHQPATISLGLADSALAGGSPQLALHVSQAVLAQHPRDVAALLRQGDAYYALGDGGRASASYAKALEIAPNSIPAMLGQCRTALAEDPEQALRRLDRLLAIDPRNRAALTDRGIALDLLGQHTEAQTDYRLVLAQGGEVTAARVDLGLSLAMSNDATAAVQILQPIAAEPDASARVRQDLAVALVMDGRTDEAQRVLLTQMSPDQARAAITAYQALRDRPLTPQLLDHAT
ncbi:tetratricopeptide repeat protein [Lichenicoccus sp.]|uniref:tetratricopeptide repeat protein n=1 Tax=Lichenicoccus sp. TaxID=2781899 RepID=UPI003D0C666B